MRTQKYILYRDIINFEKNLFSWILSLSVGISVIPHKINLKSPFFFVKICLHTSKTFNTLHLLDFCLLFTQRFRSIFVEFHL